MSKYLICGGGGFIGGHLGRRLLHLGHEINIIDLKLNPYFKELQPHTTIADLRDPSVLANYDFSDTSLVFQLAADMGGAGFVFTGDNDADILTNSALINLNLLQSLAKQEFNGRIFYSSSACMYPEYNQLDPNEPKCEESSAYPAAPDSEYGWEKLFSERLYAAYRKNYGLDCFVARFHNIYGPYGSWCDGREKAPAAICRKVSSCQDGGTIEIWGDGQQTRSFLYIEDCIDAVLTFVGTDSDFRGPVNIGSEEMVTIRRLVSVALEVAEKSGSVTPIAGPTGVKGRNSDNRLIEEQLGWSPKWTLREGLERTYQWIHSVNSDRV